jgi:hypothetical protein
VSSRNSIKAKIRSCRWESDAAEALKPSNDLAAAEMFPTDSFGPIAVGKLLNIAAMPHKATADGQFAKRAARG